MDSSWPMTYSSRRAFSSCGRMTLSLLAALPFLPLVVLGLAAAALPSPNSVARMSCACVMQLSQMLPSRPEIRARHSDLGLWQKEHFGSVFFDTDVY